MVEIKEYIKKCQDAYDEWLDAQDASLFAEGLLDVSHLLGREFIIKDDHTHRLRRIALVEQALGKERCILGIEPVIVGILTLLDVFLDLLQFSATHICSLTGATHLLGEPPNSYSSGCVGQELQLVEIFFCLSLILLIA